MIGNKVHEIPDVSLELNMHTLLHRNTLQQSNSSYARKEN